MSLLVVERLWTTFLHNLQGAIRKGPFELERRSRAQNPSDLKGRVRSIALFDRRRNRSSASVRIWQVPLAKPHLPGMTKFLLDGWQLIPLQTAE